LLTDPLTTHRVKTTFQLKLIRSQYSKATVKSQKRLSTKNRENPKSGLLKLP